MNDRNFKQMLENKWSQGKFVCIGLDSDPNKIPDFVRRNTSGISNAIIAFNAAIVDATKDLVCAYKPNIAFYEAYGPEGIAALYSTIADINKRAPDALVILDAKRADTGNTNNGYKRMAFDFLKVDAITVNPYLGREAMQPFLDCKNKGIIVLCRTSNPGADEFQDLRISGEPLYRYVARRVVSEWNKNDNCALVVGATWPKELNEIRTLVGDMPILIPGIGAQGGDVQQTVVAGKDSRGQGMIINSSRGIIFASKGRDFAEAAHRETEKLHNLINQYR